MVDTNKLRGLFREKRLTVAQAARLAGISTSTMHRKLNSGVFDTDEIDRMVDSLHIAEPEKIFFVHKVT